MKSQDRWTPRERKVLRQLRRPSLVQAFLDSLTYLPEGGALSPRTTLETGTAQCFGGAIFAAAALAEALHRAGVRRLIALAFKDRIRDLERVPGCGGQVHDGQCGDGSEGGEYTGSP